MTKNEIVATLTSRNTTVEEGLFVMDVLLSKAFTDHDRADAFNEMYDIILDDALTLEDPLIAAETLKNIHEQRKFYKLKAESNLRTELTHDQIVHVLTSDNTTLGQGAIAMELLWSDLFDDKQRLAIVQDCYDKILNQAFDLLDGEQSTGREIGRTIKLLEEIDANRKSLSEMIELAHLPVQARRAFVQSDGMLEQFDENEIPKC